jgi:hypothetical protein
VLLLAPGGLQLSYVNASLHLVCIYSLCRFEQLLLLVFQLWRMRKLLFFKLEPLSITAANAATIQPPPNPLAKTHRSLQWCAHHPNATADAFTSPCFLYM